MASFFEVEEIAGELWHRWASRAVSYPRYPNAGVALAELEGSLGVFFRAMGGPGAIPVSAVEPRASGHRLTFRQKLGFDRESLDMAFLDDDQLLLPPRMDYFPSRELNRGAYHWLTALLTLLPEPTPDQPALAADIAWLRAVHQAEGVLERDFPGLMATGRACREHLLSVRPCQRLPAWEDAVDHGIRVLLGEQRDPATAEREQVLAWVLDQPEPALPETTPTGYRPPLPVPFWGQRRPGRHAGTPKEPEDGEDPRQGATPEAEGGKRQAIRRRQDQSERDDPLALNIFEKMLSWTEMVNVNRPVEDENEEDARKAAEQIEEITLSPHREKTASRLKVELDLTPDAPDVGALSGPVTYPEWHYRKKRYLDDQCRVHPAIQSMEGEDWTPDEGTRHRIRRVQRQFEALQPQRQWLREQPDGDEFDMDALIRNRCDIRATGNGSERIHQALLTQTRDLAVTLLVDTSLSTESWLADRRVLDVEKEALLVLCHGLAACGDDFSIHGFTSRRRHNVEVNTIKGFHERADETVRRRIQALKPGHYTRMGAAIRHVSQELAQRGNRNRLLLVLTDGKPNDTDYYEGRYALEDTRKAVLEARQQDVRTFGITIDQQARQYFPWVFGRGAYHIVQRPEQLSAALPSIYQQIAGV